MRRDHLFEEIFFHCEDTKKDVYSYLPREDNKAEALKSIFGLSNDDIAHINQGKSADRVVESYQVVR